MLLKTQKLVLGIEPRTKGSAGLRSTAELYEQTGNVGTRTRVLAATMLCNYPYTTFPYKKLLNSLYGKQKGTIGN